jgi:hypothetical protein
MLKAWKRRVRHNSTTSPNKRKSLKLRFWPEFKIEKSKLTMRNNVKNNQILKKMNRKRTRTDIRFQKQYT